MGKRRLIREKERISNCFLKRRRDIIPDTGRNALLLSHRYMPPSNLPEITHPTGTCVTPAGGGRVVVALTVIRVVTVLVLALLVVLEDFVLVVVFVVVVVLGDVVTGMVVVIVVVLSELVLVL